MKWKFDEETMNWESSPWNDPQDHPPFIGQWIACWRSYYPSFYWMGKYEGEPIDETDQFDNWIEIPPMIAHYMTQENTASIRPKETNTATANEWRCSKCGFDFRRGEMSEVFDLCKECLTEIVQYGRLLKKTEYNPNALSLSGEEELHA